MKHYPLFNHLVMRIPKHQDNKSSLIRIISNSNALDTLNKFA